MRLNDNKMNIGTLRKVAEAHFLAIVLWMTIVKIQYTQIQARVEAKPGHTLMCVNPHPRVVIDLIDSQARLLEKKLTGWKVKYFKVSILFANSF